MDGIGNFPKKKKQTAFKVATLQRCGTSAILQCSFSVGGERYESLAECAESAFSKAELGLACRLGRFAACVPPAHAHPSENAKPARRLHF